MSAPGTVVVVGAGQGGFQVAASLRDEKVDARIVLIGEEPGLPYQRPPLSKAYVTGKGGETSLRLRSDAYYGDHRIEVRPGERVAAIDREGKRVHLASGEAMAYDHLVLATGARNRRLPVPGAEFAGVHQLRTLDEADAIRRRLADLRRVVVVGAGFIGLEFAAVAAAQGIEVTVIEATARPMSRAVSLPISTFFRRAHERAGVRFAFGAVVVRIDGDAGRASGVETADGRIFPADMVLVGIGVTPNAEIAADAGLPVLNGILVDEHLATADPSISAIGDCATYPSPFAGGAPTRIESVQNAVDHARCVAARLAGRPAPYAAVPWFWSDQGPLKLQIAGLAMPHDVAVVRGAPESGAFSVFCFEGDRLVGVESVNKAADHMAARKLLSRGLAVTPDEAADPGFDLKARANAVTAAA